MADGRATVTVADVAILLLGLGQVRNDEGAESLRERVQCAVKLGAHGVRSVRSQRG